jgi:holo-[acyl-carrier protein] synthase
LEIGIDNVDIQKFNLDIVSNRNILDRIFTKNEIKYCEEKWHAAQHYGVRFAGKEAVLKAFLCYGIKIPLNRIEILNKKNGIPFVNILDQNVDNFEIKISLSHTDKIAVAIAVVYEKESKNQSLFRQHDS